MKFTTPRRQRSSNARRVGRAVAGLLASAGIAFAALGVVPVAVLAPSAANAPANVPAPSSAPILTGDLTGTPIDTDLSEATLVPGLLIESITPLCGEQSAEPGLRAAIRDEVRVALRIKNTRAIVSPARALTVLLKTADGRIVPRSGTLPQLGGGHSASVSVPFDFPKDTASAYSQISVRSPGGMLATWRDIEFACVRKCPAVAVVVRKCKLLGGCSDPGREDPRSEPPPCDPAACPNKPSWAGKVAACSSDRVYCSYTREVTPATEVLDEAAISEFDGEEAEVDCSVVSGAAPQKPTLEDELPELAEVARLTGERLGVTALDAFVNSASVPASSPVTLAVLDTAAVAFDEPQLNDNSPHGRLVGLIADRVACGDGNTAPCPVTIQNHLALPILQLERKNNRWLMDLDLQQGGHLGGRGQIAEALHSLLKQWQSSAPSAARPSLVINLSFGWHSKHDCFPIGCGDAIQVDRRSRVAVPNATLPNFGAADGEEESKSLATQAVLVELARARCLGALVLAAAGNGVGEDVEGPLLPGAFNRLPAQKLNCQAMFGIPNPPDLRGGLVTAVAGVDFAAERSPLTRMGSVPHIVAPSVGLTALDARAVLGAHRPRSGSSLSTAVVSGAAARLWAHLGPGASADDVREALYLSGAPVARPQGGAQLVQLCAGGQCTDVAHEVNACSALVALQRANVIGSVPAGCPVNKDAAEGSLDALEPEYYPIDQPEVVALDQSVDKHEAPFAVGQPWGVICATCSDTKDAQTDDWKVTFQKAFAEGATDLYNMYYRIHDGENVTSNTITDLAFHLNRAVIPPDQCRQHPNECWFIYGTAYFYQFNDTSLPGTIEAQFMPEGDTTTGEVWPLDGDAISRTTAADWNQ